MINKRAMELLVQGRDLPWLLDQWVRRTPDKPCLIWAPPAGAHKQWTYAQFDAAVKRLARGLTERGLKKGQRLLLHMENCPEYLIAYFACARLGIVSVLTNTRSVVREMEHFCQTTEVVAAITQPQFLQIVATAAPNLQFIAVTDKLPVPVDSGVIAYNALLIADPELDFANFTTAGQQAAANAPNAGKAGPWHSGLELETATRTPDPFADLRIQFTSGTTSRPKAVLSTHANSIFAAQQTALAYGLTKDDVCQVVVPLFHNNGLSTLTTSAWWAGGTVVLQPKFSARNFWPTALKYSATWTSLPGAFFINALSTQAVPKHTFRFWIVAVLRQVEETFNVQARGHWGMTEMISLPLVGDPHHSGPELNIGRPIPGIEISIRHQDGSDCQPGETGNLYVRGIRGITIFKEYCNNPQANREAFDKEGWFDTGDRIHIGKDGNLYFADRNKNMLRVGGENVSASEIESVIRELDWIKECAVVGQKHAMLEEVPVAFVSLKEHAPQSPKEVLIKHCHDYLADFKMVREVYIVDDFPRATLQKIAKTQLGKSLPVLDG